MVGRRAAKARVACVHNKDGGVCFLGSVPHVFFSLFLFLFIFLHKVGPDLVQDEVTLGHEGLAHPGTKALLSVPGMA